MGATEASRSGLAQNLDLEGSSVSAGPQNDIAVALAWPARAIEPVDDSRLDP
jgi:hypothetical protein